METATATNTAKTATGGLTTEDAFFRVSRALQARRTHRIAVMRRIKQEVDVLEAFSKKLIAQSDQPEELTLGMQIGVYFPENVAGLLLNPPSLAEGY